MPPRPTPIASPCVKICSVDPVARVCIGCDRTLDEIGAWGSMTDAARAAVMALLPERRRRRETARAAAAQQQQ